MKLGPFTDAYIEVDGNDISEFCDKVTIHTENDKVEVTGFGARSKEYRKGLGDAMADVEAFSEYDTTGTTLSSSLDKILWDLSQTTTPFPLIVRPIAEDAIGENNPEYTMNVLLFEHDPIDGSVGDAAKTKLKFQNADQAGLQRYTAES